MPIRQIVRLTRISAGIVRRRRHKKNRPHCVHCVPGYLFAGWEADGISLTSAQSSDSELSFVMPAGNVSVTAKFKLIPYRVSYDPGMHGTGTAADVSVTPGDNYKAEDNMFTPVEEYRFIGWATSPGSNVVVYAPGDIIPINEDITLYAVWEKNVAPVVEDDVPGQIVDEPKNDGSDSSNTDDSGDGDANDNNDTGDSGAGADEDEGVGDGYSVYAPDTGDRTPVALLLALCCVAIAGLLICFVLLPKRRKKDVRDKKYMNVK